MRPPRCFARGLEIGSKKFFVTDPHAAIRQQHDTDCTVHEPAMLQMPSLKHSWPARSRMTVS